MIRRLSFQTCPRMQNPTRPQNMSSLTSRIHRANLLGSMVTFPNLHNFYEDWRKDLEAKGVDIRLNTDVTEVLQRNDKGIVLQTRPFDASVNERKGAHVGPPSNPETFDELVMCTLADDSLKILGKTATFKERWVLGELKLLIRECIIPPRHKGTDVHVVGGARFYDDITVTHSDSDYFQRHYETTFNAELCAEPRSQSQKEQIAFAEGEQRGTSDEPSGFRPMYFTKSYAHDPTKIEMSFDCSNYQHQFRMDHDAETAPVPFRNHVFQSIFLDQRNRQLWTIDEIDSSKIIERKWWHQVSPVL